MIRIVDASYNSDEKSIGGMLIMMEDDKMTKASPIMWKSKQIERVCHSSKDAETLSMSKLLDEVVYIARQLEILLFIISHNHHTYTNKPGNRHYTTPYRCHTVF